MDDHKMTNNNNSTENGEKRKLKTNNTQKREKKLRGMMKEFEQSEGSLPYFPLDIWFIILDFLNPANRIKFVMTLASSNKKLWFEIRSGNPRWDKFWKENLQSFIPGFMEANWFFNIILNRFIPLADKIFNDIPDKTPVFKLHSKSDYENFHTGLNEAELQMSIMKTLKTLNYGSELYFKSSSANRSELKIEDIAIVEECLNEKNIKHSFIGDVLNSYQIFALVYQCIHSWHENFHMSQSCRVGTESLSVQLWCDENKCSFHSIYSDWYLSKTKNKILTVKKSINQQKLTRKIDIALRKNKLDHKDVYQTDFLNMTSPFLNFSYGSVSNDLAYMEPKNFKYVSVKSNLQEIYDILETSCLWRRNCFLGGEPEKEAAKFGLLVKKSSFDLYNETEIPLSICTSSLPALMNNYSEKEGFKNMKYMSTALIYKRCRNFYKSEKKNIFDHRRLALNIGLVLLEDDESKKSDLESKKIKIKTKNEKYRKVKVEGDKKETQKHLENSMCSFVPNNKFQTGLKRADWIFLENGNFYSAQFNHPSLTSRSDDYMNYDQMISNVISRVIIPSNLTNDQIISYKKLEEIIAPVLQITRLFFQTSWTFKSENFFTSLEFWSGYIIKDLDFQSKKWFISDLRVSNEKVYDECLQTKNFGGYLMNMLFTYSVNPPTGKSKVIKSLDEDSLRRIRCQFGTFRAGRCFASDPLRIIIQILDGKPKLSKTNFYSILFNGQFLFGMPSNGSKMQKRKYFIINLSKVIKDVDFLSGFMIHPLPEMPLNPSNMEDWKTWLKNPQIKYFEETFSNLLVIWKMKNQEKKLDLESACQTAKFISSKNTNSKIFAIILAFVYNVVLELDNLNTRWKLDHIFADFYEKIRKKLTETHDFI
jgi:hypothetical protein